jgi:hypothetical protein
MDFDSLLPKDSIILNQARCAELPISGHFRYLPKSIPVFNNKLILASVFDNFDFVASGATLHVFDLFFGDDR